MSTVSEQLEQEIDQAVDNSEVESAEEQVQEENTQENTQQEIQEDAQQKPREESQEDTQQETQEDIQAGHTSSEDTPEDSEENTQEYNQESGEINNEALTRAVHAGLSLEEARSFSSEDILSNVVSRLEYQTQQYRDWAKETVAHYNKQQHEETKPVDPFADLPKLSPEDYDPEVVKMFDHMTGILKEQHVTIQGLQNNQDQFQANNHEAGRGEVERWFDEEIAELGEGFHDVVGKGGYSTLDTNSVEFSNRDAIASQMSILIAGYNAQGIQAPSRKDVFNMASRTVLSNKFNIVENNKLSKQLENQSKQHIQRVNKSRGTAVKTSDELDKEIADAIDQQFGG